MRKLLYGLLGLVIIAVAAIVIVPQVLDWNSYRSEIAALVRDATGRDVHLGGDIDFSVLPSPTLSANDVRIANVPGAAAKDVVRLKSLAVRVALWPLFQGRFEFQSIELVEPVIELERMRSGRGNWDSSTAPARKPGRARRGAPGAQSGDARDPESLIFDSLRITRGTVIYRDTAAGTLRRLENLDASVSAGSLAGPYSLAGTVDVAGVTLDLEAKIGRIGGSDPAPVSVSLVAANAELEVKAVLDAARPEPRLSGRITASGDALGRVVAALGGGPAPGALAQPFSIVGQLVATEKAVALDKMEISFGGARATGALSTRLGARARADISLKINRIDLDSWTARIGPHSDRADDAPPAASGKGTGPDAAGWQIPAAMDGSLELTVGRIVAAGGLVRNVRVSARLHRGKVTLRRAALRLPGGSTATLSGELRTIKGRPDYSGTLELHADNLRKTLNWLKIDTAPISAARLRKFSLKGKVKGDGQRVQVTDIDSLLDSTRLTGGVNYALRLRPSFGARIDIDRVNLDSYILPPAIAKGDGAGGAASPRPAAPAAPLAFLKNFDANLDLKIDRFRFRKTNIREIALVGTLFTGKLAIKDVRVGDLAGLSAKIKGDLDGFDAFPRFRGTVAAAAADLGGALRLAGLGDLVPARSLGRFRLSGRAEAGRDRIDLKTKVEIAGGNASLTGSLDGLAGALDYDLTLKMGHPNGAALLRRLGVAIPAVKSPKPAPLALNAKLKGNPDSVEIDATAKLFGGNAGWRGTVRKPMESPEFDLAISADHPDIAELARRLGSAAPARKKAGKFSLAAKVTGDSSAVQLSGLRTRLGKAELRGDGKLTMDASRPALQASLTGGDLDLNILALPLAGGGGAGKESAKQAKKAKASRYSREKLDLSGLAVLDAEIELAARSLVWDSFRIDDPRVDLVLKDKVLTVRRVTGKMYDGSFDLNGRLSGAGAPKLTAVVKIAGANVGKALFRGRDFDIQRGIVAMEMSLTGSGVSELALVRSLRGNGRLAVRDGLVKGFDLPAVSGRLKRLKKAKDFLKLFGSAMGGGTTKFDRLDGTFKIRKGVLRTDDLTLVADSGKGEARGRLDLPRWNMDFQSWFRLTEHANAPPFGMRVHGPPDAPKRSFDHKKLQAFIVRRSVGSFIKKIVPRIKTPAGATPAPAPAAPKASTPPPPDKKKDGKLRPEDILKGLLEGLKR